MYSIIANIVLENEHRKTPIQGNAYRPLLFFSKDLVRSGLLVLDENEILEMDRAYDKRLIKLYFYKDLDTEREFYVGRTFTMAEGGSAVIGKGVITEVIGEEW